MKQKINSALKTILWRQLGLMWEYNSCGLSLKAKGKVALGAWMKDW